MKKALQKIATVALVIVGFLVTLFLLLVTLGAFDFAAYIDGNRVADNHSGRQARLQAWSSDKNQRARGKLDNGKAALSHSHRLQGRLGSHV